MNQKFLSLSLLLSAVCLLTTACSSAVTPTEVKQLPTVAATALPIIPSQTPTPVPAFVSIDKQVNCYNGPGENGYTLIATFEKGEQMKVVGKNTTSKYWIVMDPKSNKGCWIESQYTTTQGMVDTLPVLIPAPTMALRPNAPEKIDVEVKCSRSGSQRSSYFTLTIAITWKDLSNNETGFEIYKNGNLWKTLNANVTQVYEELSSYQVIMGSAIYTVLAFNETGKSTRTEKTITYHCP